MNNGMCSLYLRSAAIGQGDPLAKQREALTRYAACLGLSVAGEYADAGYSGLRSADRPGFRWLLRDAEAGKLRHLLVCDLSRFSRRGADVISLLATLRNAGVTVHVEQGAMTFSRDGNADEMMRLAILRDVVANVRVG